MSFLEKEESRFTIIKVENSFGLIYVEILISSRNTEKSTLGSDKTLKELVVIKQKLDSSFAYSTAYMDNLLVGFVSEITTGNQS